MKKKLLFKSLLDLCDLGQFLGQIAGPPGIWAKQYRTIQNLNKTKSLGELSQSDPRKNSSLCLSRKKWTYKYVSFATQYFAHK